MPSSNFNDVIYCSAKCLHVVRLSYEHKYLSLFFLANKEKTHKNLRGCNIAVSTYVVCTSLPFGFTLMDHVCGNILQIGCVGRCLTSTWMWALIMDSWITGERIFPCQEQWIFGVHEKISDNSNLWEGTQGTARTQCAWMCGRLSRLAKKCVHKLKVRTTLKLPCA